MPLKTILNSIGGTIKTVTEFVEDEVIDPISNQIEYGVDEFRQGNPAPVLNAMSLGMSGAMAPLTQAVRGVDETEGTLLESAGNFVEDKTGIPSLVTQVAAGTLIPGPGEYKAAGKSIARGVKKAFPLEGVDNIFPPTPPTALATAGVAPSVRLNVSGGKANLDLAPRVMEIASDMKPANWSTSVRSLQKSGATAQDIEKVLSKPYHKNLNRKYEAISLKELSEDKGGWLEMLMDRQDEFNADHKQYMKTKKAADQRRMYDNVTDVQGEQQMYDNNNPIRKAVTAAFNTVAGKEWHHIFGNKEAAETMLSAVTQDPYIAVNLIHYLKKIKLPTSGTPSNIALMDKALHRKKGGYHSWAKNLGIENAGKRKGNLVISDYVQEISKGVLNGTADVNEIFSIIETYAKLNNQVIKPKLKTDFGATIISEMDPVMKFVQGVKPSKK